MGSHWAFHSKGTSQTVQVPSRFVVNSVEAAIVAAAHGAGVARVASYQIDEAPRSRKLVKLLEAYEPLPVPVSHIYVSQGQAPLKLRAFLDFAIPGLRKRLGYTHV